MGKLNQRRTVPGFLEVDAAVEARLPVAGVVRDAGSREWYSLSWLRF